MGGGIDAAGEARHHDQRACEIGGEILRHALAVGRGIASADQGNRAFQEERRIAQHRQHRRRIVQQPKQRWIRQLAEEDQPGAQMQGRIQFVLRIGVRGDERRGRTATGARQAGQRIQRGCSGCVTRQQTSIGDRADTFRTGQPQPVQRIGWRQARYDVRLSDQCVARFPTAVGGYSCDVGRRPALQSPTQA